MREAAGVLLRSMTTGSGLVLLRPEGIWGFPGGHHEPEDGWDLQRTALRELREETGIAASEVKRRSGRSVIELLFFPERIIIGPANLEEEPELRYVVFVLWLGREIRPALNDEHHSYDWLHPAEMLSFPCMHPGVYAACKELRR